MGWKVLNKTVKENYKAKRRTPAPKDTKLVFKDAHPPIIDEETWHVVQRLRETKRTKTRIGGTPNPLTGVLYCADCGEKMYHKQGKTGRANKPHDEYVCTSYRHYARECTCHYIRVSVVEDLILTAIRRVSGYVRNNEAEFIERVHTESALQQESVAKEYRKKLTQSKRRRNEIGGLIKKLYESFAADKIPEKHFNDLLNGYDAEQTALDGEIERLQTEIDSYNTESVRADKFIGIVKKHTEFTEYSAALLNEFVEKIIVHEAVKADGKRTQKVDIYLNYIGKFELPEMEEAERQPPETLFVRNSYKKLRQFMTAEQLERERDRDRRRYAKVRDARIAAENAKRAEILEGTAYALPAVAALSATGQITA